MLIHRTSSSSSCISGDTEKGAPKASAGINSWMHACNKSCVLVLVQYHFTYPIEDTVRLRHSRS